MKIIYFPDTDTLHIQIRETPIAETFDLTEPYILDVDAEGDLVALTIDLASEQMDLSRLEIDGLPLQHLEILTTEDVATHLTG